MTKFRYVLHTTKDKMPTCPYCGEPLRLALTNFGESFFCSECLRFELPKGSVIVEINGNLINGEDYARRLEEEA